MTKGLLCFVYRAGLGDATNGGITSKHDKVVLIGPRVPEIFSPSEDAPAVYLGENRYGLYVTPEPESSASARLMFGGNFVYTSDSRFPASHPIKVFDRDESRKPDPLRFAIIHERSEIGDLLLNVVRVHLDLRHDAKVYSESLYFEGGYEMCVCADREITKSEAATLINVLYDMETDGKIRGYATEDRTGPVFGGRYDPPVEVLPGFNFYGAILHG